MTPHRLLLTVASILTAALLATPATAQVGKGLLDPNVASEAELGGLPHMTPPIAKALVDRRPFGGVTELNAFLLEQKLTQPQINELYVKAFVHVNLNTGTREEILLIPGIGNRMLREFKEYRPYTALAQFHREIGKYVDNTELARLEQYVFVPVKK